MNVSARRNFLCPSCGGPTGHSHLYPKNGCEIFACRECGLGRTETSGFHPEAYYTGQYFSGGHADGYDDYLATEPVLRRQFAREVAFVRSHRASGKLIEVGCAYGFFLQEARAHFDVAGIELAEEAAAYCRGHGLTVATGVADSPTITKLGSADVFVMLDVIEHLPDPHATLSLLAGSLEPGGIIVLTTGDFSSLYARWAGPAWRLMTPPQHLWFFTPESVRRMGQRVGLSVERLSHPWKLVPMSLVAFQLRRMLGLSPRMNAGGGSFGLPVNLFDAMRVVLRKPQ